MITGRIQLRIKRGSTSTTIRREDGELDAATVLSAEAVAQLTKRVGSDVQAIYIEVIEK